MKNKSFIIIAVLAVFGVGLIAGAAVYYSKAMRKNDLQPDTDQSTEPVASSAIDSSPSDPEKTHEDISPGKTASEDTPGDETAQESETGTIKHGGISPEFKNFWDDYESFMDSYAPVIKDKNNPDYKERSDRYDGYVKKAAQYENSEKLTDEEVDYMASAHARISAKYASAWLGETE